jgi:hypothetical protein
MSGLLLTRRYADGSDAHLRFGNTNSIGSQCPGLEIQHCPARSQTAARGRFRKPAWMVSKGGPIAQALMPRRSMSETTSGPAAMTTSCPASAPHEQPGASVASDR